MIESSSISNISECSNVLKLGYRMHHTSVWDKLRAAAAMKPAVPGVSFGDYCQPEPPTLADPRIGMA
jgi:hypothetical protein